MKGYKYAIFWVVMNDDVTDITDNPDAVGTPTMALIADLYGKSDEKVMEDVKKIIKKHNEYRKEAIKVSNAPGFI